MLLRVYRNMQYGLSFQQTGDKLSEISPRYLLLDPVGHLPFQSTGKWHLQRIGSLLRKDLSLLKVESTPSISWGLLWTRALARLSRGTIKPDYKWYVVLKEFRRRLRIRKQKRADMFLRVDCVLKKKSWEWTRRVTSFMYEVGIYSAPDMMLCAGQCPG